MVETTAEATREIVSDSRRWNLVVTDQHGKSLESANGDIISMTHSIETTSGSLTIGDLVTNNINLLIPRDRAGTIDIDRNAVLRIVFRLRNASGSVRVGKFVVNSVEKRQDRININLKDLVYLLDLTDKYESNLTYPATLKEVLEELYYWGVDFPYEKLYILKDGTQGEYDDAYDMADSRLYVKSDGEDLVLTKPLPAETISDALSMVASYAGCMLAQDRDGKLTAVRPSKTQYHIGLNRMMEPQFSGDSIIKRIECEIDDETVLVASGSASEEGIKKNPEWRTMSFANPAMTQSRLDEIAQDWLGYGYTAALIDHRLADPRLDPLDIITFDSLYEEGEHSMPLMSMSYNFDGGLSCNLQSTAD